MEKRITFVGDATTKEAFIYILRYSIVIIRNICRSIDKLVRKHPWTCMIATVVTTMTTAVVVSFVFISKARAERDSYNKKNVELSEKVASYEALYGKEVK